MRSTERPDVRYRRLRKREGRTRYRVIDAQTDEVLGTVVRDPEKAWDRRWSAFAMDGTWLGSTDVRYDAAQCLVAQADANSPLQILDSGYKYP